MNFFVKSINQPFYCMCNGLPVEFGEPHGTQTPAYSMVGKRHFTMGSLYATIRNTLVVKNNFILIKLNKLALT